MKRLGKVIFSLLVFLGFGLSVNAASATIGISTNASRVVVGNNVRVTVTVSSSQPLGVWEYTLVSDTSMFSLVGYDVDQHYIGYANNNNTKSVSYNYTFKAKKTGTARFYITGSDVLGFDESSFSVSNGSRNVTVITQQQLLDSYSKNNYLSSLSVEGFELTPEFNKETLEYSVTLPPETTNIVINATKEDNTASISGDGEHEVSLGLNKFEIIVTAQNGTQRKYIVNATVEELEPIEVKIDGKIYTVVRQAEVLDIPHTFTPTTVYIDGKEVPALHSEITNITLVGLKDESGKIALYDFDINANVYVKYQEIKFNSFNVVPQTYDRELDGYDKEEVDINGVTVEAFVKKGEDFYIIYGLNTETGESNLYRYDTKENTLQRYVEEDILSNSTYKNFLVVMALFGGGLLLSFIINLLLLSNNKNLKRKMNTMLQKKNIFTDEVKPIDNDVKKDDIGEMIDKPKEKKKKKEKDKIKVEDKKEEITTETKTEDVKEVNKEEKKENQEKDIKETQVNDETKEFILDEELAKKTKKRKKS